MTRLTEKIFRLPVPFHALLFMPLFYALAAVYFIGTRANYSLPAFTERYIGKATMENFDVSMRVSQFYLSVLLFIAAFILLYLFIIRLTGKKIISSNELLILNLTSFCGLILLYVRMLGTEIYPGLRMLLVIHAALFLCIAARNIYARHSETNLHFFTWILIISFCLLFTAKKVFALFGFRADLSSAFLTGLGFALLLVLLRRQVFSREPVINHSLVQVLEPLVWMPLLSVASDETYFILNQKGIFNSSPAFIFVTFLLLLIGYTYLRMKRKTADIEQALSRRYFPVLLAGLSAFIFYSPVQNATSEMFEMANGVLPVQQFYEFGRIPLTDTFSSHMLSDFFMMLFYTVFNGYHNLCFSCYDFIFYTLAAVIVYFILRKITGNGYWAFFIALFYPYAEHLVPSYVSLALLSLLALIHSQDKKSVKSYLVLFFIMAFLIVWRIDLGFANAVAAVVTLSLLTVSNNQAVNRKVLFKSLLWVLSAVVLLFLLTLWLSGKKILHNVRSALDYFSSVQSYGQQELTFSYDIVYYSLNYFFPVLVFAALGYALFKFFTSGSAKTKMLSIGLFYLSVYYFMNFQRGLIRHGLNEQWDIPLTSFAFLTFMIWMLIFFEKKNLSYSFIAITALMTVIISRYKFPEEVLKRGGLFNSVYERIKHFPAVEHEKQKINRMPIAENFATANYTEIESFMKENFLQEESFADFSNTPMLYYYLHRESPHFFAQSPLSYHSEELQKTWIKEIESSGTKLVLFSSYPEVWFDVTDGVPNTLRHYLIAEYLFTHFRPGYILNHKTMWIRNDINIGDNRDTIYSGSDIKRYGLTDAVLKEDVLITGNNAPSLFVDGLSIRAVEGKKYFLTMSATNLAPGEEKIHFYYNNSIDPRYESKWKYTSGSNIVFSDIPVFDGDTMTGVRLALTKNSQFVLHDLNIVGCDYIPDYYSDAPRDFNMQQLAYVWGNMDLKFKNSKHKVLREVSDNREIVANYSEKKFLFNPVATSTLGCYVIIRIRKKTDDKTTVVMNYGEGQKKSGGFIFNLPVREAANYAIRVSTQYNWYKKANNWITIYPMGNDIEVEKIQITTAD